MNLTWKDKTVIYILLLLIIFTALMHFLSSYFIFDTGNYLTIISFLFLAISAILVYFQIRTNLSFNKRKAAFDFSIDTIPKELLPLFKELYAVLKVGGVSEIYTKYSKIMAIFEDQAFSKEEKVAFRKTVIAILNFYERMAIGLYKQVLDNDICYDNIGNNLIEFHAWVKPFVDNLQATHHEERLFVNFQAVALIWTEFYIKMKNKNERLADMIKRKQTIINKNL